MSDADVRDRILVAAEIRARRGGYHGFSFRDIAGDVGVKSSSVHYWFPTKADLGQALAERYTRQARDHLGDAARQSPEEAVGRLITLFRDALVKEDRMCLCGLFGAERDALPPAVDMAVAGFFHMLLDHLGTAFQAGWSGPSAPAILARLEGGMILARALRDPTLFDVAIGDLA